MCLFRTGWMKQKSEGPRSRPEVPGLPTGTKLIDCLELTRRQAPL